MVCLFLIYAGKAFCENTVSMSDWSQIVEKIGDKGKINWSAGYIEAVGIGVAPDRYLNNPARARAMAIRAARLDAYRNLLETAKGVRVNSTTLVRDAAVESDEIRSEVEGIVQGAQMVGDSKYMSDGSVEVTVRMPLTGEFAKVVVPKVVPTSAPVAPKPVVPEPKVTEPVTPEPVAAEPAKPAVVYTGLVVDAREIKAKPAMSPKIIDENGKEVYGSMQVDREYAIQQGMSGYARDLTAAQSNQRVTNNPITVKGIKTEGPGQSDIVVSNADANMLRAAADNLTFLKQCRVMIVLK
jgi:hypothetical protein